MLKTTRVVTENGKVIHKDVWTNMWPMYPEKTAVGTATTKSPTTTTTEATFDHHDRARPGACGGRAPSGDYDRDVSIDPMMRSSRRLERTLSQSSVTPMSTATSSVQWRLVMSHPTCSGSASGSDGALLLAFPHDVGQVFRQRSLPHAEGVTQPLLGRGGQELEQGEEKTVLRRSDQVGVIHADLAQPLQGVFLGGGSVDLADAVEQDVERGEERFTAVGEVGVEGRMRDAHCGGDPRKSRSSDPMDSPRGSSAPRRSAPFALR